MGTIAILTATGHLYCLDCASTLGAQGTPVKGHFPVVFDWCHGIHPEG